MSALWPARRDGTTSLITSRIGSTYSKKTGGALERAPLYKRAMQAKKIQWLGLKLNPPLLLGLNDENETDAQDR